MEEDIEILKEMIDIYRSCSVEGENIFVDMGFTEKECKAIENVLADRERLINNEMEKIFSDNQIREYQKKHYINKDKIKAKIEELEKDLKNYKEEYTMWCYDLECLEDIRVKEARIEILKELLGE